MNKVTKDEFYAHVGRRDAIVSVVGDFPYTSEFTLRNSRNLIGKAVDRYADAEDKENYMVTDYFINQ